MRYSRRVGIFSSLLGMLLIPLSSAAQHVPIWQMQHSSWRGHDGAPLGVDALGQAEDGTIWLASPGRLTQFDGIRFTTYELPASIANDLNGIRVAQMMSGRNGDLWMFRYHGAPLVMRHGKLEISKVENDSRMGSTWQPFQDKEGHLFALQDDQRVVQLGADDTWHETRRFSISGNLSSGAAMGPDDTLWAVKSEMLWRVRPGATTPENMNVAIGFDSKIIPLADHSLWIMSRSAPAKVHGKELYSLRHIDEDGHLLEAPYMVNGISFILATENGDLWVTAQNRGTWKIPAVLSRRLGQSSVAKPQLLEEGGDFQSGMAGPILEAKDGSVWIAGNLGLDSFRPAELTPALPAMHSGTWTLCQTTSSGLWIADDVSTLVRIDGSHTFREKSYGSNGLDATLLCGEDGAAWLASGSQVLRLGVNGSGRVPRLPGTENRYLHYQGAALGRGRLTVAAVVGSEYEQQLWTWDGHIWIRDLPQQALPGIMGMFRDDDGTLYLSFINGSLRKLFAGRFTELSTPQQKRNIFYGFVRTSYGLIGYGQNGIMLIQGDAGRYLNVLPEEMLYTAGVVEGRDGDLWLVGQNGIVNLPAAGIKQFVQDGHSSIPTHRLVEGDLLGTSDPITGGNSASKDSSGRLWFATLQGVVAVDPSTVFHPTPSPRVSVFSVSSRDASMNGKGQFPPGTTDVTVAYRGLLLSAPQSVSYRYRLLGAEVLWHDVGEATEATYAHLRPGTYRFQVMAGTGRHSWSLPIESNPFSILPYFWQTRWFFALSLAAGAWVITMLFQHRVRAARERARLLADELAIERTRIARDLHDTLLQGIQGLLLNFSIIRQQLLQGVDVIPLLERTLSATEDLVIEGRERVGSIRHDGSLVDDLHNRLRVCSTVVRNESGIDIPIKLLGAKRELVGEVSEELYMIAREALRNSTKHANAAHISVTLTYKPRLFRIAVQDDGSGFDATDEALNAAVRQRWGLSTMRERAETIRAQMRISTRLGHGTLVSVTIDAKYAYKNKR